MTEMYREGLVRAKAERRSPAPEQRAGHAPRKHEGDWCVEYVVEFPNRGKRWKFSAMRRRGLRSKEIAERFVDNLRRKYHPETKIIAQIYQEKRA